MTTSPELEYMLMLAKLRFDEDVADAVKAALSPLALFGTDVVTLYDPVYGLIEYYTFVEDHDGGDEDSSERTRWTMHARLLEPVRVHAPIHNVVITGTVGV